jgi:hypothetical protein
MMNALACVGSIQVPPPALRHPNIREARACAMTMDKRPSKVVGTTNTAGQPRQVELYGWGRNVPRHVDDTGWIYFTPLVLGNSAVFVPRRSRYLVQGAVYRLDDHIPHWTQDTEPVVCAFLGPFERPPRPKAAIAQLQAGVNALAERREGAPRVSDGFKVPANHQVWALEEGVGGGVDLIPIRRARREGRFIARCGLCLRFAVKLDGHFPYFLDMNRCVKHLASDDE